MQGTGCSTVCTVLSFCGMERKIHDLIPDNHDVL